MYTIFVLAGISLSLHLHSYLLQLKSTKVTLQVTEVCLQMIWWGASLDKVHFCSTTSEKARQLDKVRTGEDRMLTLRVVFIK